MNTAAIADRLIAAHRGGMRVGVVTDIDGTIAPIALTPDAALVNPLCRAALDTLSVHLPLVAALTGRAATSGRDKVGLERLVYVGNHGYERLTGGVIHYIPGAEAARPALEQVIHRIAPLFVPGMLLEDKGATVSIHYRAVADPDAIALTLVPQIIETAVAYGLHPFAGRRVVEIRPALPIDKGTGLRALVADYALEAVVFLGDDVTDVDAMRAVRLLREAGECEGYAFGVTAPTGETPSDVLATADALLSGVDAVANWLVDLAAAVRESST